MLNCKLLQFFAVVVFFSSSGFLSLLGVGSCPKIGLPLMIKPCRVFEHGKFLKNHSLFLVLGVTNPRALCNGSDMRELPVWVALPRCTAAQGTGGKLSSSWEKRYEIYRLNQLVFFDEYPLSPA